MQKEFRSIDTLRNWDKNPRAIKKDKFEDLKRRITKRGQFKPLIITPDGEVLGGNMRLRAMKELGVKDVWVSVVEPKDEADKIEIALTDNEEMGYYEEQALAELIAEFQQDIDLTKYSVHLEPAKTLKEILNEVSPEEVIEDEAPEVQEESVSELGKIYQLGKHRVMCGDSTKIEDVERLMAGEKADMVFTDPPYGMRLDADYSGMKGWATSKKYSNVIGDHSDFNDDFINIIFSMFDYVKEKFLFGGDYYVNLLPNFGKDGAWIVWDKRVDENKDKMFGSGFEMLWSQEKHQRRILRGQWAGFMGDKEARNRVHPTQKPTKILNEIIQEYSSSDQLVVDLFLGSGSTLIACEQTNRICYGMELDQKYVDVIRKRYAKYVDPENWEERWQEMTPETAN